MDQIINRKRVLLNTSFLGTAQIIGQIISFITSVAIANYFGAGLFGVYAFALYFTSLFDFTVDFGINFSALREISRDKSIFQTHYLNFIIIKLVLSFLLIFVFILFSKMYVTEVRTFYTLLLGFVILALTSLNVLAFHIYKSFEKMGFEALMVFIEKLLILSGVMLFVVYRGSRLYDVFLVIIGALFLIFITNQFLLTRFDATIWRFTSISISKWPRLIKMGAPFIVLGIITKIYFQIDFTMLKIFKENSDIGIYAVAFKFISAGILLPATFVDALFPALNKIHDPNYFRYVINKAFKYLSIIALPIGLGTLVLAEPLIHFFYNEQYTQSILCLQILSWAMVLMFGNWITGYALISLRKDKVMIMIVSLTAVVNIIANYILIPRWSFIGASVATIISEIIIMALELIFLYKYVQYKTELIPIIKIFLCAALMALVLFLLRQNVFFAINAIIGLGIFVFLLFITKTISLKELQLNK